MLVPQRKGLPEPPQFQVNIYRIRNASEEVKWMDQSNPSLLLEKQEPRVGKSCWPGNQAALLPAMQLEMASLAIRGLRFLLCAIRGR